MLTYSAFLDSQSLLRYTAATRTGPLPQDGGLGRGTIRAEGLSTVTVVTSAPARARLEAWSLGALLIAGLVLLPILAVLWIALRPTENVWPHLIATVLPGYLANTFLLMAGVGVLTGVAGTGAAWLVTMYRFPGVRWLSWLLLLPLAVPAYVGAYALVDFLDYSGPVQVMLRELFGWQSARDYWFPDIRSRMGAVLVLSAALSPYVYLLARTAFREQSGGAHEVARALGASPWGVFLRVGLPLARPAIVAGMALAMMETVNDFGVVDYFAVQTLTTGIFTTWLAGGNAGGAAQIAAVILALVVLLVAVERASRRRGRRDAGARQHRLVVPQHLPGWRGYLAAGLCLVPVLAGFVLPISLMGHHALISVGRTSPGLGRALFNTVVTAGGAAVLTVTAAIFLVYGVRLSGRALPRMILPLTGIGYAAPGAVLAVGILLPLARFDHMIADAVEALTGRDPGLLITGTAVAVIYAYFIRFFAIGQGAVDAAFTRISPTLPMAARSLGRTAGGALREVYLPLMRGTVGTALLLVFVDGAKELPATLLLRPFNYQTLAIRVHERASLENLTDAAPAALLVTLVGMVAVGLLARANP